MKKLLCFALLASAPAALGAQTVDVGAGDWSKLPEARVIGNGNVGRAVAAEVERMGRERSCEVPGLGPSSVDLSVPFVVQLDSSDRVQRIVLRDLNCPKLETLFGRVVQRLAANGEYKATRGPGWYRSSLDLTVE